MTTLAITETEWQAQLVELAHFLGWKHLHVRRTRGKGRAWVTSTNRVGWPDLFLWHPRHGFVAIECKVGKNQPTPEQLEVLDELSDAGAVALVAYPSDLDTVRSYLQGQDPTTFTTDPVHLPRERRAPR